MKFHFAEIREINEVSNERNLPATTTTTTAIRDKFTPPPIDEPLVFAEVPEEMKRDLNDRFIPPPIEEPLTFAKF